MEAIPSTHEAILYVEDEEDDAFLVRHAFEKARIANTVITVPSGEAALEYLEGTGAYAHRPQHALPRLVLLDLNMPGTSGFDVLKQIRTNAKLATLIVLVLSSSNQEKDIQRAYELGAKGYLVKPGNFEAMVMMAKAIGDFWLLHNRSSSWIQLTATKEGFSASGLEQVGV